MAGVSRREFGAIVFAGVPVASMLRSVPLIAAGRLTLGVTTSSFRELARVDGRDNVDDVIRALRAVRATDVELALANVEPAPPSTAPFMGGTPAYPRVIVLTPEEIAATNAHARRQLRGWRLQTGIGPFEGAKAKMAAAGITMHACALTYNDSFTDEEIDATFRQIKALGVNTVASPLTMAMAIRLAPLLSGTRSLSRSTTRWTATRSARLRRLSSLTRYGCRRRSRSSWTSATSRHPTVTQWRRFREHQARVSHVVIRDRLRNGGASQPFGEGDTPIPVVLNLLITSGASIPALVEYDYIGLRSAVDEVAASLNYLAQAAS